MMSVLITEKVVCVKISKLKLQAQTVKERCTFRYKIFVDLLQRINLSYSQQQRQIRTTRPQHWAQQWSFYWVTKNHYQGKKSTFNKTSKLILQEIPFLHRGTKEKCFGFCFKLIFNIFASLDQFCVIHWSCFQLSNFFGASLLFLLFWRFYCLAFTTCTQYY